MTVMAEKLREAGVERDVLYLAACEALRRSGGNIERAVALIGEAVVIAARDMKFGQKPDAGQNGLETHRDNASDNSGNDSGAGHGRPEGRGSIARDKSESGGGQAPGEVQSRGATTILRPIDHKARRAAAIAGLKAEAFETFQERYGIDLRRTQKHELTKLASKHRVIARVVEAVDRHAPSADPFAYVSDIIKGTDLELFVRQAESRNDD